MDHVVLILSLLMVKLTGAGTAAALVLHVKLRSRITREVAVIASLFLLSLLVGVLSAYLLVILPPERYPTAVFAVIGTLVGVLVYSGLGALLRSVQPEQTWPHLLVLALAISTMSVFLCTPAWCRCVRPRGSCVTTGVEPQPTD